MSKIAGFTSSKLLKVCLFVVTEEIPIAVSRRTPDEEVNSDKIIIQMITSSCSKKCNPTCLYYAIEKHFIRYSLSFDFVNMRGLNFVPLLTFMYFICTAKC